MKLVVLVTSKHCLLVFLSFQLNKRTKQKNPFSSNFFYRTSRQISPKGVPLQIISPKGVVFKNLTWGGCFIRNLHGLFSKSPHAMATLLCKSHVACKPPLVLAIQVQCKSPVSLASPSLLWETASLTSGLGSDLA